MAKIKLLDEELINKREEMMEKAGRHYQSYITQETVTAKMRNLFGDLLDKSRLDEKDLEHRAKHGGMSAF